MGVDQIHEDALEVTKKKSLQDMVTLKNEYNTVSNELLIREDGQKKNIEFGGSIYQDSSEIIHIPFDKDHRVATQYGMKFKDVDVSLVGIMKQSRGKSKGVTFQLFQSGINGKLSKENMLLDSRISRDGGSLENRVTIELKKGGLTGIESQKIIKRAKAYLSTYFGYEQERKEDERVNEIQFQELVSKKEEGNPEDLLEEMDWSVGM